MLEKVRQMLQAFLETIKAKGEESIDSVDLIHQYVRADDDGATVMSASVKVEFRLEEAAKEPEEPKQEAERGQVH